MHFYKLSIMTLVFSLLYFNMVFKISFKSTVFSYLMKYLFSYLDSLKLKKLNKMILMLTTNFMIIIMLMNFLGLFPYFFSFTSQMNSVLFLSLSLWMSMNLWNFFNNFSGFISHTIPEGTPKLLVMFLFMIELISNLIRPMTMTLRLMGNMVAGHIFLSLIFMMMKSIGFFLSFMYFSYMVVEMLICFLQAYIITTLTVMYYSEI